MNGPAKRFALRLIARHPVYRALPPGGLRTYAALKYHGQREPADLASFLRSRRSLPSRWLPTAILAAKAAFRAGQDDLLAEALDRLEQRHPDAAPVHVLRADLHTFHGHYEDALRCAEQARRLRSDLAEPVARVVKLGYRVLPQPEADQIALNAISEFPLDHAVLWQVATACTTATQYERVQAVWDQRVRRPVALLRAVRQLAVAAARAGEIEASVELYRRAIATLRESRQRPGAARTRLAGLGAHVAIDDLSRALDGAGVPFFLAAGTVLGLVREGQPIGGDGDIDVGVFADDWDRDALIDLFRRDPQFDLDLHPQSTKIGLRHRGGAPIDIFRFYGEGDRIWHNGVFVRWHNTPFDVVRRDFGALNVPVPEDADRYLTDNYGDWRTPDPSFDAFLDAPNLDITWPAYHRSHLLRRAYELMADGDVDGAESMFRRADHSQIST